MSGAIKLKLFSDFKDYYDFAFDSQGEPFNRYSRNDMPRDVMLRYLESIGCKTPLHGTVVDVVSRVCNNKLCIEEFCCLNAGVSNCSCDDICNNGFVVVYDDMFAHCGDGKRLLSFNEALEMCPNSYCTLFIPGNENRAGSSLRFLQVGNRKFWLKYWSFEDWRSNVGDGDCVVLSECINESYPVYGYPVFAIDFIFAGNSIMYAIDFNTAPGLKPLQDIMSPTDVYTEIKKAIISSENK